MPGSIQVSVLEFIGLQSSTPSDQIYVKVSMGKREYLTLNKGDFSFPLTTLRENVIVTLQDNDGNEISHTAVETRLLIQKGTWDDMFPLNGGGHIHLKLQFVLTEEDRQRIRIMRETALRKKHDELVSSGSRSMVKYDKGTDSAWKNPSPNETDRCKDSASSTYVKEVKKERSLLFSTEGPIGTTISMRQKPTQKAHGSVRNMISAFESSAHQDMRTKVRQQMTKSQSVNNLVDVPSSESKMQKVRSTDSLSGKICSTLIQHNGGAGEVHSTEEKTVSEDLARRTSASDLLNQDMRSKVRPNITKSQSGNSLVDIPSSEGSTSGSETQKVQSIANEILMNEEKPVSEDLARRATASERASFSGDIHDHCSDSSLAMKKHSGDSMFTRKSHSTTYRRGSQESWCDGVLADDCRSTECSGAWIFPDQGRRLCVSTAGKQVLNVIGGFWSEIESTLCPGNMISPVVESRIEHFVHGDNGIPAKESGEAGRESTAEGSGDAETPRGPLGQVMRVAIMVGFTALVVFTRQRKPDR